MSGLYIHIPFCRQKCSYCNFHFSTTATYQQQMVDAICREMELRKGLLPSNKLDSIYIGGGTPSILSTQQLVQIFQKVSETFQINPDAEITMEANPDDLTNEFLQDLRNHTPVNRLSIGVQSFHDEELKLMNRAHNASESWDALQRAKKAGFNQFNMDLIFGIPGQTMEKWEYNLQKFLELDVDHLSCYSLTIEENTAFHNWIQNGKMEAPSDEDQADFFLKAAEVLGKNGYEQYEISNYCRNEKYAKHNTAYWQGAPYLGIGPSAHSFDGKSRYFNIAHNPKYLKLLGEGKNFWEEEELSPRDQYNEYILTGLRTKWGVSVEKVEKEFRPFKDHFEHEMEKWIANDKVLKTENKYILTTEGKLLADTIMSDLFY